MRSRVEKVDILGWTPAYTHWGGAGDGGVGEERGVYHPPPEHSRTIHCASSYHELVSGGGTEDGTTPLQAMVVAARPGYPGDKGRSCSIGRVGGYGDIIIGCIWRLGYGSMKLGG